MVPAMRASPSEERSTPSERGRAPKLYGRDREIETLGRALDRVRARHVPEIMLISGPSGMGKSSLALPLRARTEAEGGLYIAGKFEQYRRGIPYFTLTQALSDFFRGILAAGEGETAAWRARLTELLGKNASALADIVPELAAIVDGTRPLTPLGPAETENRFHAAFLELLRSFALEEPPLVVFLDDLQWADPATLGLLEFVVSSPKTQDVFFVFAFRSEEMPDDHPMRQMIDRVRQTGVRVDELVVGPLATSYVTAYLSDAIGCAPTACAPLASLVTWKGRGNPFAIRELIAAYRTEGLLVRGADGEWRWDAMALESAGSSEDIVAVLRRRIARLSPAAASALATAAAFGSRFRADHLALAVGGEVSEALASCVAEGFLVAGDNGVHRFAHDRVQQAAYMLLPESERSATHLRLGRMLLDHTSEDELEGALFEIVAQWNAGTTAIVDEADRRRLADLNFRAGIKAKLAVAYDTARKHLRLAKELSYADLWAVRYADAFALHLELAEVEFLAGGTDAAAALYTELLGRARSVAERTEITVSRVTLLQIAGRFREALEVGLAGLEELGIALPSSDEDVGPAIAAARARADAKMEGRSIASLADLPLATSPAGRAAISLMASLGPPTYLGRPSLFPVIVAELLNASLEHGNTEASCFGYSMYAMLLVSVFGDIDAGYDYSRMSIALNEKLDDARFRGTVLHIHGSHINVWKNAIETNFPYLERGFAACVEAGDVTMANYNGYQASWQWIERGIALDEANRAIERYARFALESKHRPAYLTIRVQQQLVNCLRGLTGTTHSLDDNAFSESDAFAELGKAGFVSGVFFFHVSKAFLHVMFGRFVEAARAAAAARAVLPPALAHPIEADLRAVEAIAIAGAHATGGPADKARWSEILDENSARLRHWAAACPANFEHLATLADAAVAEVAGDLAGAGALYEEASVAARRNGFAQYEGLASELASRKLALSGAHQRAAECYQRARDAFERWGANAKLRR